MTTKHPRLCDCGDVIGGGSHDLKKDGDCESYKVAMARSKGGREAKDVYLLMQGNTGQNLLEGYELLSDDDPADYEDNY